MDMENAPNEELLTLARQGDQRAWTVLVHRYGRLVWSVPRSLRLTPHDAADVSQTTWLLLSEHLTRIDHPDRLGAWLVTTARREALRVLRLRGKEEPLDDWNPRDDRPSPEEAAIDTDTGRLLWHAFTSLTDRCREILRLVAYAPDLTFTQVATAVGIPPGSLGPTRGRCLQVLRRRITPEAAR
ncbi:sigma-70 family RNA polymerase sigma factor [Saccharothrix violaceirubra]|uniref:RNA polymerase sigma factor (Sigma-70 family) n=1 Tax=Saccharothrix violaceirubra TaxID=413306 RepID=A0A7W7SXD8_9PSEU|nr:sigma-70 family RNA polymerase sigma factor [Saccharothrix violaceirubra]MBB4962709.1 RNA polymerase sigma factor (sigma-70 family) [Saccharothrix violaceirubra]